MYFGQENHESRIRFRFSRCIRKDTPVDAQEEDRLSFCPSVRKLVGGVFFGKAL
jgi:hypothetical protein